MCSYQERGGENQGEIPRNQDTCIPGDREREGNGGEGKYFDTKKPKVYDSDPANIRKIY